MQKKLMELSQEELLAIIEKERTEAEAFKKAKAEELAAKEDQIQAQAKELSDSAAIIEELQLALEAAQAPVKSLLPVIVVGKKSYQVTVKKFSFNGEEKTAEDLKTDKKLALELVKIESGILLEVK